MTITSYHLIIKGRVQGVSYRNWTFNNANQLGVKGWVKNLENGDVEAHFEGDEDKVKQLINACYEGPNFANVTTINQTKTTPQNFTDFQVLY